jgi:predicted peptidase
MKNLTRRGFVKVSSAVGAVLAGAATGKLAAQATGFQAASNPGGPRVRAKKGPGLQGIYALCEVTGGGQKVYGIAVEYDAVINPASLALDTYTTSVFPAARGGGGGMGVGGPGAMGPGGPGGPGGPQNSTPPGPKARPVAEIYTNSEPALLSDRKSVAGKYVIAEFAHDPDLSARTSDGDKVSVTQDKDVRTADGTVYAASTTVVDNSAGRGNDVVVRGIDAWEQSHWWWDDSRSAMLEYSIYLPKSFLKPGGENKEYPLVIAITHSGTSYDGTTTATLTDGVIASIWGMPEEQAQHECVVITPRYERTTMNDYWEHSYDLENTYKLVEFMLSNKWNYGNPNREDRADKVLKIDPKRVYTTGWSMGAMSSIWMMAKHPNTFAAGLIIAGQQRPSDMVDLAKQNVLIITGTEDGKATPWNEKCVPIWEHAGAKVTRPDARLDPALIFPVDNQKQLTDQINHYLDEAGNITFLTFANVDHMQSARKFFYIKAARDWLFRQVKA